MTAGGVLLDYQKRWITADQDYLVYVKSRQIGISWAEALWSVRSRLTQTKKRDHWFVSADEQTSKEFIKDCRFWADILSVFLEEEVIDANGVTTQSLVFPNGARIMALSSNPKALRGKRGDVTLDEFAFHQDAEEMYKAAHAVRTWGGQLRIISTENGPLTLFHRLVTGTPVNGFALHKTTLVDAVNDGLAVKIPGKHKALLPDVQAVNTAYIDGVKQTSFSEAVYEQEYMCAVGDTSTVITDSEYDACILPGYEVPEDLDPLKKYGPLYVGIDIGRSKNLSVIWVVEEGLDTTAPSHLQRCYRTVAMKTLDAVAFGTQYEVFDQFISHKSVFKAVIDAGGIGMQLAEDLRGKHGGRVEQIHIGAHAKARLVERTKKYIAQQRVSLPADNDTKNDVMAMRRITTRNGAISYDGNSGNSHCDRFVALALALEAADNSIRLTAASTATNGGK